MSERLIDIITDTLFDGLKMLPFLFLAYLLIEYIEQKHSAAMERALSGGGRLGFLTGALTGLVPQCGFSAMASELYSSNVITLGTLLAVFLATSDEAVPVLVAEPRLWNVMVLLLVMKFITAAAAGFLIDRVLKRWLRPEIFGGYRGHIEEVDCHEHEEEEKILPAAVRHTAHVFGWILLFVFLLNVVIEAAGTDGLARFLAMPGPVQIAAAGLVGMIPNCAASVLLTQLYSAGSLSFPALFSGLCTGAGIGPLVLLQTSREKRKAARVLVLQYVTGVCAALLISIFM